MERPKLLNVKQFEADNGTLTPFDDTVLPFAPCRVFTVNARAGCLRGRHAHRACIQLLVAISGKIQIDTEFAGERETFVLEASSRGLLLPPLTWSEQKYLTNDATLLAICSEPYDEADYIRNYQEFLDL